MAQETPVFKLGRNERRGSATHTHIHRLNIIVCNIATRFPVQFPLSFGYWNSHFGERLLDRNTYLSSYLLVRKLSPCLPWQILWFVYLPSNSLLGIQILSIAFVDMHHDRYLLPTMYWDGSNCLLIEHLRHTTHPNDALWECSNDGDCISFVRPLRLQQPILFQVALDTTTNASRLQPSHLTMAALTANESSLKESVDLWEILLMTD